MEITELIETAKTHLSEMTGLKPMTVSSIFRNEEGWHVRLDMLEMARIPPATDLLGDYEVLLDDAGHLVQFRRRRTHLRGESMEEEAVA